MKFLEGPQKRYIWQNQIASRLRSRPIFLIPKAKQDLCPPDIGHIDHPYRNFYNTTYVENIHHHHG